MPKSEEDFRCPDLSLSFIPLRQGFLVNHGAKLVGSKPQGLPVSVLRSAWVEVSRSAWIFIWLHRLKLSPHACIANSPSTMPVTPLDTIFKMRSDTSYIYPNCQADFQLFLLREVASRPVGESKKQFITQSHSASPSQ